MFPFQSKTTSSSANNSAYLYRKAAHFLLFLYKVKQGNRSDHLSLLQQFHPNNHLLFSVTITTSYWGRMEYKEICLLICLFSISTISHIVLNDKHITAYFDWDVLKVVHHNKSCAPQS